MVSVSFYVEEHAYLFNCNCNCYSLNLYADFLSLVSHHLTGRNTLIKYVKYIFKRNRSIWFHHLAWLKTDIYLKTLVISRSSYKTIIYLIKLYKSCPWTWKVQGGQPCYFRGRKEGESKGAPLNQITRHSFRKVYRFRSIALSDLPYARDMTTILNRSPFLNRTPYQNVK